MDAELAALKRQVAQLRDENDTLKQQLQALQDKKQKRLAQQTTVAAAPAATADADDVSS